MNMKELTPQIEEVATMDNAVEWEALTDKYVFCLDLLDLSLAADGDDFCDRAVNTLEQKFEALIHTMHEDSK